MMFGDLARRGWHTWVAWTAIVFLGVGGLVLLWA